MRAALPALFLLALGAVPADAACKSNPALTGICQTVRGAVFENAGALMLETDKPKQSLIVAPDAEQMPPLLGEAWEQGSHARVKGIFEICPLAAPPGVKARVICIETADELTILNTVPSRKR